MTNDRHPTAPLREVPVDWEALEDAFENNAPEVHSYLHLTTGEVLRVVDGVADPQMHARISADTNYLRIDPVSSREQYRWMERFIPMVDEAELRGKLAHAIDGKGAFRRFKDVLMTYSADRERWFAFRSERLRTFMEAWLNAHAIQAVPRPGWSDAPPNSTDEAAPDSLAPTSLPAPGAPPSSTDVPAVAGSDDAPKSQSGRRQRNAESLRKLLVDLGEALGPRELDLLVSFAEFLKARRAARGFAHHHEHMMNERDVPAATRSGRIVDPPSSPSLDTKGGSSS
ncbi:MAG: hypothetical protein KIT84_15590 [Labilithrix sp.]|nr:hypothetical protein [Labilithrix sp.]MCW5812449.1 hypothetical protein [Labilithrix sp.]